MIRFLSVRFATMLLVLFVVSVGLFGLSHAAPGGPLAAMVPPDQLGDSQEWIEMKTKEFGLDKPLPVQYLTWIGKWLTGDMGQSFQFNRPVATLIGERIAPTLEIMLLGMIIGTTFAVILGIWTANRKGKPVDYIMSFLMILISSIPAFFLGMILIFVFAAKLGWLPSAGMSTVGDGSTGDLLRHLILPVAVLSLVGISGMMRFVRAGMLEELTKDYVRTAIAKGATRRQALLKAMRNSLLPIVTVFMMSVPGLLSGAVVLEQVFAWPGMGTLTIQAINARDYPIILGFGMITAILVVVCNFISDILMGVLDPRVRLA